MNPARYDAITARALATLPLILELGGHLLKPGGRLLAMKGAVPDEEIAALPAGWRVESVHPLTVPGLAAERHLVVVGRTSPDRMSRIPSAAAHCDRVACGRSRGAA